MPEPTETLQVRGSKGLIGMAIAVLTGGALGAGAVSAGTGRDPAAAGLPTPYLSRVETEAIATARADRAEERAGAAAQAALARSAAEVREACDRQLQTEIAKLYKRLDKIDEIATDIAYLKASLRTRK